MEALAVLCWQGREALAPTLSDGTLWYVNLSGQTKTASDLCIGCDQDNEEDFRVFCTMS